MDATALKTRHGLILQGVVAEALRRAGITFKENWQYDPDLERPDFTIPNTTKPKFAVEVHQTDARNSFQMKILRSFNAVTEAKVFFGDAIVSVNVLFGDPDREVPASNVRALFGFFDVNIVPRKDASNSRAVKRLEDSALTLASDESLSVADATEQVASAEKAGVDSLSSLLASSIKGASMKAALTPLWQAERKRVSALGASPLAGKITHYKRAILQSVFLSDEHFAELSKKRDPNKCSAEVKEQLVLTKLAEVFPSVRGDVLVLSSAMREFISDPKSVELRALCEKRLDEEPAMHWFFEDVRNVARRKVMVDVFFQALSQGSSQLSNFIAENIGSDKFKGIEHGRCWMVDLAALYLGVSHNEMNRQLIARGCDPQQLGNPFNQISYKSSRFMTSKESHKTYVKGIIEAFDTILASGTTKRAKDEEELARRLLALRLDGAIKLQKLNPLYLVIESVAEQFGLTATYQGIPSFLSDLSGSADPVGKNFLYLITDGYREVLINALYIGEGYGSDHKADEWSARRRSLGYRSDSAGVHPVKRAGYIFVVDGVWTDKSIKKLHAAGWTHVIRLSELESVIKDIFKK